jgi:thiamine kinase-like enzyme
MSEKDEMQKHFAFKWTVFIPQWQKVIKTLSITLLENHGTHRDLLPKIKKYNGRRSIKKFLNTDSKFVTLIHGDMWVNNLAVREETEDNPARVKFIDFGNVCVFHPMYDIVYFLYMNTDRAFRQQNFDRILQEYFDIFSKYLSGPGVTFTKFKEEVDDRKEIVMLITMMVCNGINY